MAKGSALADFRSPEVADHDFSTYAEGGLTLANLYDIASIKGPDITGGLDQLPKSEINVQATPRPPGYCAQTVLHFGCLGVATLLDYGATCNAIPEEVVLSSISNGMDNYLTAAVVLQAFHFCTPRQGAVNKFQKSLELQPE